jgi:hypothetical protein
MHLHAQPVSDGHDFYRSAIEVLRSASVSFLVGGAFALRVHTGVKRDTKDFDLLVRPQEVERTLEVFRSAGFAVEMTFSHWLAKVRQDSHFRSGNGICDVDDEWFKFARVAEVLGTLLPVCPAEEMLWQKAFIMERERFDGADVQHLLRSCGKKMDWDRLLWRFGADWQVLLSHLVLFNYIYPGEQDAVPQGIMDRMVSRLKHVRVPGTERLCRGTLLSRLQYLEDVEQWGYADARTARKVPMNEIELRLWTAAAREQEAED